MSDSKKERMNVAATAVTAAVDEKLEAIKQLIFGDNIQEYDEEFKEVKDLIADCRKKSDENLLKAVNKLNRSIEEILNEIKLLKAGKLDKKVMAQLINNVGEQIQS